MAHEDVANRRLSEERVIDWEDCAARISKHHFDAMFLERGNHDFSTCHLVCIGFGLRLGLRFHDCGP